MQIHELNTFAGTPGDGNYLAIDNGSDTGKISGTNLLAPVNARIDNLAANVTPDSVEVILNTPQGASPGPATLSKSVANFDYLEFYFAQIDGANINNAGYLRVPVSYNNVDVSIPAKDGSGLWVQELKLAWSGTTLTISNIKLWEWDGSANSAASSQSNVWVTDVVRVIGIKTSSNTPAELADMRIGVNGNTFPSAGYALRYQLEYLADAEIEGYDAATINYKPILQDGTLHSGAYMTSTGPAATSAWNYYEFAVNPGDRFKVTGYSVSAGRLILFFDNNGNFLEQYPASAVSPGAVVTVTGIAPAGAAKMYLNQEVSHDFYAEKDFGPLFLSDPVKYKKLFGKYLRDLSIEDYAQSKNTLTGTVVSNYIWDRGNNPPIALNGWEYLTVNITPDNVYYISGTASTAARLFSVYDSNNTRIYEYPAENTVPHVGYQYTAPANAAYMIVNARVSDGHAAVQEEDPFTFVRSGSSGGFPLASEVSPGVYNVGNDNYVYSVNTAGSGNGLFNYSALSRLGAAFKGVNDDITPTNFVSAGYIGANHGYNFIYEWEITNHGLTNSDIGKVATDSNNAQWVIIKIISSDKIEVGCLSSNWWRLKTSNIPASINFGTALPINSSTLKQLYPSVKNGSVSLVENNSQKAVFVESYDIIDLGVGIDALIANVGSNTNDSIVSLSDSLATIRNIYEFQPNGVVIIKGNLIIRKASRSLNFYGGVQSARFGTTGEFFAVPGTSIKALQTLNGSQVRFDRSIWDDSSKPPFIYEQAAYENNAYSRMFFTGFIADEAERNGEIYNEAGFFYTSYKMYPFLINPNAAQAAGKTYSFIAFRLPAYVNEVSATFPFVAYCKIDDVYYLVVKTLGAVSGALDLPPELYGKNVEVLVSEYVSTSTELAINALDITATQEGTLFVKLY